MPTALATRLGGEVREHERFATAKVHLGEHEVDIATARAESYPHPGALPEVEPTEGIAADLARRDFTINAMAVPLRRDPELIDPHRGREDLEAGLLRVLHAHSFDDDPTRALRAARYAARFGFELEHETAELLREANLSTVSTDRREAELLRLAGETEAVRGFALLGRMGPGGAARARGGAGGRRRRIAHGAALDGRGPTRPGHPRRRPGSLGRGRGAGGARIPNSPRSRSSWPSGTTGRAGPRPRARRRVARPLTGRVALGRARDRRRAI